MTLRAVTSINIWTTFLAEMSCLVYSGYIVGHTVIILIRCYHQCNSCVAYGLVLCHRCVAVGCVNSSFNSVASMATCWDVFCDVSGRGVTCVRFPGDGFFTVTNTRRAMYV